MGDQQTLDEQKLAIWLGRLDEKIERLEQLIPDKLNEAYQQGVADERKARTGHDPKAGDDA
jgi:hypothetical protein